MFRNKITLDLYHALKNLENLDLLLYVGLKRNSSKGNIDILAACFEGSIKKLSPSITASLTNRWPHGNFSICDDSVRFKISKNTGGIAIYDSRTLIDQVTKWTNGENLGGQHRSWATGYWIPEAFLGDLATAESLFDPKDLYSKIKSLLFPYPDALSKYLSDFCIEEIALKLKMLKLFHEKDNTLEATICSYDIVTSMIRLAFAKSQVYFRGFRELSTQSRLLKAKDLPLYETALQFSRKKNTKQLADKITNMLNLKDFESKSI